MSCGKDVLLYLHRVSISYRLHKLKVELLVQIMRCKWLECSRRLTADDSSSASAIYFLCAIFAFQSNYLISAQPSILGKLRSRSRIEGQDTAQNRGIGIVPLTRSLVLPTRGRDLHNNEAGGPRRSDCFKSGSWTSIDSIQNLTDSVCKDLVSRALNFEKFGDSNLKNPEITYSTLLNGDPLLNNDGMNQNLTFILYDQKGNKWEKYMTQYNCKTAYNALLDHCNRGGLVQGGIYFVEESDDNVAYSVSWPFLASVGMLSGDPSISRWILVLCCHSDSDFLNRWILRAWATLPRHVKKLRWMENGHSEGRLWRTWTEHLTLCLWCSVIVVYILGRLFAAELVDGQWHQLDVARIHVRVDNFQGWCWLILCPLLSAFGL